VDGIRGVNSTKGARIMRPKKAALKEKIVPLKSILK